MESTILQYQEEKQRLEAERKAILTKAKEEARELLVESNRRIELAIKEIREAQAEKEETKRIREELQAFEEDVNEIDVQQKEDAIQRKIEQIQQRQKRREERKRNKAEGKLSEAQEKAAAILREAAQKVELNRPIAVGDSVRIKGTQSVGTVSDISGKMATVLFTGGMRSKVKAERLEHARQEQKSDAATNSGNSNLSENKNLEREGFSSAAASLLAEKHKISTATRQTWTTA